jgi:hypothetical protein
MAKVLDAVPLDRVRAEAAQIHPGRALLTLLVGLFWVIGWLAGKAVTGLVFCWAAVKVGYSEARDPEGQPRARPA